MLEQAVTDARPGRNLWIWLFNPFHYIAGGAALAAGLVVIVAAGLLGSLSHSHFDGVLDFHTGMPAPLWLHLVEGPIDWLALCVPLWVGGVLISKSKARLLDLFGTQALARFPYLILAAVALLPGYRNYTSFIAAQFAGKEAVVEPAKGDVVVFGLVILVMLLMAIWMVVLMYRSFAISYNVRGGQAIAVFIGAVLVGEVVSKLALFALISG